MRQAGTASAAGLTSADCVAFAGLQGQNDLLLRAETFMRDVRDMLEASGFDMTHYHEESFGPAAEPVLPMI